MYWSFFLKYWFSGEVAVFVFMTVVSV